MEFDLIAICGITFLVAVCLFAIIWGILAVVDCSRDLFSYDNEYLGWLIPLIISICAWVGLIFVGIGLNTNEHKAYIQSYLIQKQTIETSVDNGNLSGLERVELVNKATELNGELAKRKVYIKYWNAGVFDNTIYDDIEFIDLG